MEKIISMTEEEFSKIVLEKGFDKHWIKSCIDDCKNDIEKIKTLHNICMLKVLNGNYYSQLNDENLNIEPDFNMICKEFEKNDKFLHELSYPLLDLGTLEMFKFVENTEENTDI